MSLVVTALLLVAAVAVTNLVLTLGVVRRLREHAEQLAAAGTRPGPFDLLLGVGERPDEFSTRTVVGETISARSLATPALVGFFSPTCSACTEWMPRFVSAAESLPAGGQALAVVVSTADTTAEVAELQRVAQVVVEPIDGSVSRAFRVRGFPALCRLGTDGAVQSTDNWTAVGPWVEHDRVA